jgi:hypothetical protein
MMPKQRDSLEDVPDWARQALQGVTYWMGHRRCFYRNHPLTEGALVAEICNLVQSTDPLHAISGRRLTPRRSGWLQRQSARSSCRSNTFVLSIKC